MISSYSRPAGQRNSSISLPTTSLISFRGGARCFLVTESADGCIDSRRWRDIVTRETLTAAVIPTLGLISTLPSTRGWDPDGLVNEWYGPAISHLRGNRVPGTYHGRGDTWIADQKIAIRRAGHSHEGGHVDSAAAAPPWARSCGEG